MTIPDSPRSVLIDPLYVTSGGSREPNLWDAVVLLLKIVSTEENCTMKKHFDCFISGVT